MVRHSDPRRGLQGMRLDILQDLETHGKAFGLKCVNKGKLQEAVNWKMVDPVPIGQHSLWLWKTDSWLEGNSTESG